MHYLDDFLIVGPPNSQRTLEIALQTCSFLGIPIAPEKIEGPTTRHGWEVSLPTVPFSNALIAAFTQAPYGKGAETIVDTSVLCTWQLDLNSFRLIIQLVLQVDVLLRNVVQELGSEMKSGIHCELYKLLLYHSG